MHRMLVLIALMATTQIFARAARAADPDADYYTIGAVQTHEVSHETETKPALVPGAHLVPYDLSPTDISTIINIGEEIWKIVEANKPVANVSTTSANALPKGVTDWTTLAGWQAPESRTFETTFTNLLGMTVIDFQYRVRYTPGGNYQGVGKYLADVTVETADLSVDWGYTFGAQVTVPSVVNAGSVQAPIAAADIVVQWSIDTVLKHEQQSAEYYVRGDGQFSTIQ